ncbi:hypothetical protein DPEC_G00030980 [Dallia pectoralis]|uniref:Uncharacterized protein n=1 Tax=Dallia pectoralis TaxID=75939 RepID=A0ACC2HD15_DALPE|nr:hypothetical protein DPEC_G00030980 [Dallia pectoralis]
MSAMASPCLSVILPGHLGPQGTQTPSRGAPLLKPLGGAILFILILLFPTPDERMRKRASSADDRISVPNNALFPRTIFLLKGGLAGGLMVVRLPTWTAHTIPRARPALRQLHVISIKPGQGLSIKKTQGNLWALKEIPSARSGPERRPFVRGMSHILSGAR